MKRVAVIIAILGRSAIRGLRGTAVTSSIAIVTIAVALFLVGAFALVVVNMQGLIDRFGHDLPVAVYLEPGLPEEDQVRLAERVATIEGVARVELVSKEAALARFEKLGGGAELLEGLEENPLPESLDITLHPSSRTPGGLRILELALDGLPGIDDVVHGQEWVEGYARAASLIRVSGFALGAVLALATLLIVANTIRLGVYAREDELDILALVGASRTFVRTPFLLEGTFQGAIGGVLASVILWTAFRLFVPQLQYGLVFFLGNTDPRFFATAEVFQLIMGGAALGLLGSVAAMSDRRAG
jgi:cell division transport system permease protein